MNFKIMKGISPIVAAVLLIVITLTLAGALALWATNLVGENLPETETEIPCKMANFDFLSCKYNSSTGILIFTLTNRRNVELENLTAFLNYPNGSASVGTSLSGTLKGSDVKSFSISDVPLEFASILIKTHCPEVEVSNVCVRT